MSIIQTIGRMLLGAAIFRSMRRSPVGILICAAILGLLLMFAGNARAQDYTDCFSTSLYGSTNAPVCPSRADAYATAIAASNASSSTAGSATIVSGSIACGPLECRIRAESPLGTTAASRAAAYRKWNLASECPVGSSWDDVEQRCVQSCVNGSIRMLNGECSATPDECSDLNSQSGFGVAAAKPFQQRCLANGCMLAMTPGTGSCTSVAGADGNICHGEYRFTGAVCGATPPPVHIVGPDTVEAAAQNDPQACTAAGGGSHDYCVKRSGEHCMTSAQGRQLCWKPGETGTKTDGPVAQVRNAGTDVVPPALNLPSGDTLQSTGQKTTATSGSTTTTTSNYTTIHGTNAGPKDQGQPADGTGSDEAEEGSASGGADCEQRPVVSDPMLEMVATQAWATRCAVEAGNTAKVTGDVGDCSVPFSVEGDNANAVKLRAMRAQICGDNQPEWTKGDAPEIPGDGEGDDDVENATKFGISIGPAMLDDADLFGGGTCPQMSFALMGTTISTNDVPQWCNVVSIMRALILLFGAYTALMILMGRSHG